MRSKEEFQNITSEMVKKGLYLYKIETYLSNNSRNWAGLFKKTSEISLYRNGLSTQQMGDEHFNKIRNGYKIIDVEVYKENGNILWAGVWKKGNQNLMSRNLDKDQFINKNQENNEKGYYLIDFEVYLNNGKLNWAGIWGKNGTHSQIDFGTVWCDFLNTNKENVKNGYILMSTQNFNYF